MMMWTQISKTSYLQTFTWITWQQITQQQEEQTKTDLILLKICVTGSLSLIVFRRREKKNRISPSNARFIMKEKMEISGFFFFAECTDNWRHRVTPAFVVEPLFNIVISSVQRAKKKAKLFILLRCDEQTVVFTI